MALNGPSKHVEARSAAFFRERDARILQYRRENPNASLREVAAWAGMSYGAVKAVAAKSNPMGRPKREPGSLGQACPKCGSGSITLGGKDAAGKKRFRCTECSHHFTLKSKLGKHPANFEEAPIESKPVEDVASGQESLPPDRPEKPVASSLGRTQMNIKIYELWSRDHMSPEDIKDALENEGYYFSVDMIRARLRMQGVEI